VSCRNVTVQHVARQELLATLGTHITFLNDSIADQSTTLCYLERVSKLTTTFNKTWLGNHRVVLAISLGSIILEQTNAGRAMILICVIIEHSIRDNSAHTILIILATVHDHARTPVWIT